MKGDKCMRRHLHLCIVLFVLFISIGSASAFVFQTGPFGTKYTGVTFTDFNYSTIYGGASGLPLHPAQDPNNISGNVWGISSLTNVFKLLDNNPENNSLSGAAFYNAGSDGKYYFAIFGGLTYLSDTGPSLINRELRLQAASSNGTYLKVYEVSAADAGVYDAAVKSGPNVPGKGAFGTFATEIINAPSAKLWLDAIFSQGTMMYYDGAYQSGEVELLSQSNSVTGSTEAYLTIVGGSAAPYFKMGVFPIGFPFAPNRADLKVISDTTANFRNGSWQGAWTNSMQDPITGEFIVPVPALECAKFCDNVNSDIAISARVTNTGGEPLVNVDCTDDPVIPLNGVPIASLPRGAFAIVTGNYSPSTNPSTDTITCTATGELTGTTVSATCSATCGQEIGQCRMTGGSETPVSYFTLGTEYYWTRDTYTTANGSGVMVSTGGQIGAPMASATGPSFGEWEHQQHCTGEKGACSDTAFAFDFKAGTASGKAKDTTIIDTVACGDTGWCMQARCAPFKQIFWDGIGLIKNITPTFRLPAKITCSNTSENSLHYFKAHVGDFGEPGSTAVKEKSCKNCPWKSGGVEIENIKLLSPVYHSGDKGGQDCPCGCGDWYEIEIHCTEDPASPIIYRFQSFINTGNLQLHPPVGESCH